ncbi:protein-L-isoaspartate(D-aspartate) O-methyltransferase [Spongiactinospora gelatinilytica]|uniref:Protein-L-isoaspartate O-methyltransferase n=1 Tax=Spongiactinospora gelatinilytica TaxID=2666298 RepID=A0A2W2E6X6_9ACTN|nr:methyltransferase domain-containing protein [Spongiactinospora gelatinilytica]PZG20056.1 protein-L-isoaspartate(D-aspartate) O-methyltransferase [Spongiactinospora gelatinilytica]
MDEGIAARIERLIDSLGDISAPVKRALRAVPRHQFIPSVGLIADDTTTIIDHDADPAAWLDAVYANVPIVTQLNDGATDLRDETGGLYTSSNSAPGTVTDFLDLLDPAPGHRVLEIGTGTGWTAALLSHLVGAQYVTSIEVDSALAEQAAKNLSDTGMHPHLITGDGADGSPERAPFDRVHVTCGIRTVPYAWVEQTRPGGRIVLPYDPGFVAGHALRLAVRPDGTAAGTFTGFAAYMMMRSQRVPANAERGPERETRTRIDPRTITEAPPGAALAMSALTGLYLSTGRQDDRFLTWVTDPAAPAQWALITHVPGADDFEVYQVGDRPVWDEVVDAYFRWVDWGEPRRDRFGMTVSPDGQQVWLDTPQQVIG